MKAMNLSDTLNTALVAEPAIANARACSFASGGKHFLTLRTLTYGDPKRWAGCDNLLSQNAVKFSEHGGEDPHRRCTAVGGSAAHPIRISAQVQAAGGKRRCREFLKATGSDSRSKGGTVGALQSPGHRRPS